MSDETTASAPGESSSKNFWGSTNLVFNFNFAPWGQTTANGCWLAAFKIVYQWANEQKGGPAPSTVDGIVTQKVFGGDSTQFEAAKNNGLAKELRATAFSAVGMSTISRADMANWDVKALQAQLDQHGPMVFTQTIVSGNGSGNYGTHALVINGANAQGTDAVMLIQPYNEDGINSGSGPYTATTMSWIWSNFTAAIPPDGSYAAQSVLAYLT